MMLPIALSLINANRYGERFAHCLLLAVAYGASIGGIATIIGTPPNTFVASYMRDVLERDIGFAEWMSFGLPLSLSFLCIACLYLVYWRYPQQSSSAVHSSRMLQLCRANQQKSSASPIMQR